MSELERFRLAFIQCLEAGVYPSPTELNHRLHRNGYHVFGTNTWKMNTLNGKLASYRRTLMREFAVPFQRDSPWGKRGEVPRAE